MAIFPPIAPVFSAVKNSKPLVRAAKFSGSGNYEQRTTFGLNQNPKEWSLTFTGTSENASTIETFLDARAADAASFEWTPPDSTTTYRWRCDSWTKEILTDSVATINATFRQVFDLPPSSFRIIPVSTTAYNLNGRNITVLRGFSMPTLVGSYVLTGADVSIYVPVDTVMPATVGSYVLSGGNPSINISFTGFRLDVVVMGLSGTPTGISLGVFALVTPVPSVSLQMGVNAPTFTLNTTVTGITLGTASLATSPGPSVTLQLLVTPVDFF